VFTRQMSQIGEKGYRAAQESPGASELDASILGDQNPDDAELVSYPPPPILLPSSPNLDVLFFPLL